MTTRYGIRLQLAVRLFKAVPDLRTDCQ